MIVKDGFDASCPLDDSYLTQITMFNKKDFLLSLDELIEADPGTLTGAEMLQGMDSWNSLAVVGFIALVDEQFGITLSPNQIAKSKTVDELMALLGDRIVT